MIRKELLLVAAHRSGRQLLSRLAGVPERQIAQWLRFTELLRINGIGPKYADLLFEAGADSLGRLRVRNPDRLRDTLLQVNSEKNLVRRLPSRGEVQLWVNQAQSLEPLTDLSVKEGQVEAGRIIRSLGLATQLEGIGPSLWEQMARVDPNQLPDPGHPSEKQDLVPPEGQPYVPAMAPKDVLVRPKRYANAALMEPEEEKVLPKRAPLKPGREFRLRVDIGELSPESAVEDEVPIPEDLLPDEDLWLEVVVSSTRFDLGQTRGDLGKSNTVFGELFLPADGGHATTPGGERFLYVWMRAPMEGQLAQARISYYYKNDLVQSQLLVADIGTLSGGFRVEVDYTLSSTFAGLRPIPDRPTLSFLTNDNGDGTRQIILRSGDRDGKRLGAITYELDEETIGELVRRIRKTLSSESVAPARHKRRRRQLISDLKKLAPLGWKLWAAVVREIRKLYAVLDEQEGVVLQVARPVGGSYTFPWGLMYDIHLEDEVEWTICPMVDEWDEALPLVDSKVRRCPEAPKSGHDANTLCPFGFWGYRYPIEQLASTDRETFRIFKDEPSLLEIVVAETQYKVDQRALSSHVQEIERIAKSRFPQAEVSEGKDKKKIQELLGRDLPLVYFYCHGERPKPGDPATYLGVGKREAIRAEDIKGWILNWFRRERKVVWGDVRPLIFINACHSIEINPDTLTNYLDALVGEAHAAGVIGTEVKVHQRLAMDLAAQFFRHFLSEGWSVDQAMHDVRMDFLAKGNLFGLVYTTYCRADLKLVA